VGLRLEKHLDKLRAQYEQQKQEEEDKKNFFKGDESPTISRSSGDNTEPGNNLVRTSGCGSQ